MLCTQADVEAVLQFTFTNGSDPTVALYIGFADGYIKRWANRRFEVYDESARVYRPVNTYVAAPDYPVRELDVVEDGTTLVAGTDYWVEPGGVVRRVTDSGSYRRWDPRPGKVTLAGRYGYDPVGTGGTADLPDDIVAGAARMVAEMYKTGARTDGAGGPIASESLADHTVTFDTTTAAISAAQSFRTSGAMEMIKPYRRTTDGPATTVLPLDAPPAFTP